MRRTAAISLGRNKELARAALAIWSTGDFSRVPEIFAPRYIMHQHHHRLAGGSGDLDLEALRTCTHEFRHAFPDFHDTIDLQLAEGDLVATRFTSSGTHEGVLQDIAPTGRKLSWTGTVIDQVNEDRIVESWGKWDMMGMLQQLGAGAAATPSSSA